MGQQQRPSALSASAPSTTAAAAARILATESHQSLSSIKMEPAATVEAVNQHALYPISPAGAVHPVQSPGEPMEQGETVTISMDDMDQFAQPMIVTDYNT